MPATLFTVYLDENAGKFLSVSKDLKKTVAELMNKETQYQGKGIAAHAMRRMSDTLKPGHKFNVGASGAASENFDVVGGKEGLYLFTWNVVEKSNKPANRYIRWGFNGVKPGRHIPEDKIRLWLAQKNIFLRDEAGQKTNKRMPVWTRGEKNKVESTSYFLSRSKKGKKYGKSKNKAVADPALKAIIRKLERFGSDRTHWAELYPKGQGRYDYVGYVVQRRSEFMNVMRGVGEDFTTAVVTYLLSGKLPNKFGYVKMGGSTSYTDY